MAKKGNPYENEVVESSIKTPKVKEVYLWEYRTMDDVKIWLPYSIEEVYYKRLHSSFAHRLLLEFKKQFTEANSPAITMIFVFDVKGCILTIPPRETEMRSFQKVPI
jgi:transposase InsO family protein